MEFLRTLSLALAACAAATGMADAREARQVVKDVVVAAPPSVVWHHWTTLEGLSTLFVPPTPPLEGAVELRPDGPYELYFLKDNPEGMRGGEGARIIAYQEERMLSVTWANRPDWPIRPHKTHVVVTLEPVGAHSTRLHFVQSGFGEGDDWDTAYDYFTKAWGTVIGRLVARYEAAAE